VHAVQVLNALNHKGSLFILQKGTRRAGEQAWASSARRQVASQQQQCLTSSAPSSADASAAKSVPYHCSHSGQLALDARRRASSRPVSDAADRICWCVPRWP
jgi:hypothetical protein